MPMRQYYVYIMASHQRTTYVGVTNNLERRAFEHSRHFVKGFASTYNVDRLVYYEVTNDIHGAIAREKEIKGWRREKRVRLIESLNPDWRDLTLGWAG